MFEVEARHISRPLGEVLVTLRAETQAVPRRVLPRTTTVPDVLVLVLQYIDIRIRAVTIQISSIITSQGTMSITHRVPRFWYTTSLTLHCCRVLNS